MRHLKNEIPAKAGIQRVKVDPSFRWGYNGAVWIFFLFLMMSVYAAPAYAVACYTEAEAEAEQGVRIHSELMVIGLNCQHRTPEGQKNYYHQYKELTAKNGGLFAGYEATLIRYFTRAGAESPEAEMNRLRTQFANKISGDAAKMRPDLFCSHYAPRIPKAAAMTNAQLRHWASTFFRSYPLTQPICASAKIKMR